MSPLRPLAVLSFALALLCAACGRARVEEPGATAHAPRGGAAVVRLEGPLCKGTLVLLSRAIEEARESGRDVLLIDLDTPGGEVELMWKLHKRIRAARDDGLRTVTWVHDRALSAGVFIALASERIYVTPLGAVGAATPVTIGPTGIAPLPEEGGVREKLMSSMRADARRAAEGAGRSPALAEAMIDAELRVLEVEVAGERRFLTQTEWGDLQKSAKGARLLRTVSESGSLLTLTGSEAVAAGFADGIADTLERVLEKAGAGERAPLVVVARTSERALAWLDLVTPLLIVAGLALAFTELKAPGFGLPGILALACFALAFAGRYVVGLADVPHLVLVTIGFALVAVELFLMPGTVWFGLSGGLLVLAGLLWSQIGPGFELSSELDRRFAFEALSRLVLLTAVGLGASLLLVRILPRLPLTNRLFAAPATDVGFGDGLPELAAAREHARVGARGRVRTALRPVGKVVLGSDPDREYEARCPAGIVEHGASVVVVEVDGDRLVVEPVPPEPDGGA